ncbi:hypothetical protein Ahy_B07g086769 isoform C [Arachis hypogaea]|uniref:Uncharacterized protein n=2 Tax=Arachis hypogaea TaxID=3818 RepID=A0A444YAH4_ARAHY|nr:hypothetical protein Ahy_B07g086769 isoform C [Arachis hypogaea]
MEQSFATAMPTAQTQRRGEVKVTEALEGKIIIKTQSSIFHYGVRLTLKGSVNMQVWGGSTGVVELFYGVIKPIPILFADQSAYLEFDSVSM